MPNEITRNRPDIIVILTDEERAAPSYENSQITDWRSENLSGRRWFTDHGVDFRHHYVASLACVPSRPCLLTGQYPDVHGVSQTDGLGKTASDSRMRWLRPDEVPTMGHWFRAAGYDTHYDGKWHVSHADIMVDGRPMATNTATGTVIPSAVEAYLDADPLDEFGFSGWVGPEPHGAWVGNSGFVRDPLIADRVVSWLNDRYERRAAGESEALRPFLLVCSFVNPHDIVLWPLFMRRGHVVTPSLAPPPPIPASPTDSEDLSTKPATQIAYRDAYYSGYGPSPLIRRAYEKNLDAYREFYYRLHHDVDGPIDRVRKAVTDGGSTEAVLVLSSDHGDQLGSHGGLHQKWYQVYDESTRVPFRIVRIGEQPTSAAVVTDQPTSHVDLLPTLLGLAGADANALAVDLASTHTEVHALAGRDLSALVSDPSASPPSAPVYMITRDNMLDGDGSANALMRGKGRTDAPFPLQIKVLPHAATNVEAVVVVVPTDIDSSGHMWKLARTFDDPSTWSEPGVKTLSARTPSGPVYRCEPIPDQWELYDLTVDPVELLNCWDDPGASAVRVHMQRVLESARSEKVPARNQPWEYVARPDSSGKKPVLPPRPARALRRLVQRLGLHPDDPDATTLDLSGRRALVVATNHGTLEVGRPTGVFASELTAPYYVFLDSGMEVDVASPLGGDIPFDPLSLKPVIRSTHDDRFLGDAAAKSKVLDSLAIGELEMADYDIVFFAGGWGAAFDLGTSEIVGEQVTVAAAAGAVLGGVCHGPLGLLKGRTAEGELLVMGRRVTAVTDKQVHELGIASTPQHPETELRKAGALFESETRRRDFLANHVVVDGDLVTGQNQNSGPMVARRMMQRVLEKDLC